MDNDTPDYVDAEQSDIALCPACGAAEVDAEGDLCMECWATCPECDSPNSRVIELNHRGEKEEPWSEMVNVCKDCDNQWPMQ